MGKFSYVNECADKFLIEAADGQVAEKIRIGVATKIFKDLK